MRWLINVVRQTKFVYVCLMIAAIPAVSAYCGFLVVRWTKRLFTNGAVAIFTGLALELKVTYDRIGWPAAVFVVLVATSQHYLWWRHDPTFFAVWWRAQWRYWTKYRWMFDRALRSAGLTSADPLRPNVKARIIDITANEHVDVVEVAMLDNQTPELYQYAIQGVRRTLGAIGGRAVESKKSVHNVTLWLWKTDPLRQIVRPYDHRPPPPDGDWAAWFKEGLAVARLENGDPFKLDLITVPFHWLLAGESRSGKSGAIGSYLGAAEYAIHEQVVKIDAIDPARGVELIGYHRAGLFNKFVYAEMPAEFKNKSLEELYKEYGDGWIELLGPQFTRDVARTIHQFYGEMCLRGAELLGKARVFTPSKAMPLRQLLIDEIATVMALGVVEVDGLSINIALELFEILRQGLKFGFMVIGAVQDPLKSQVNVRDLFTYFTGFGGLGAMQFDKLFGTKAYKAAGEPKIPKRLQGVAFTGTNVLGWEQLDQLADEYDTTIRVRFTWETDEAIAAMGLNRPKDRAGGEGVLDRSEKPSSNSSPAPKTAQIGPLPKIHAIR